MSNALSNFIICCRVERRVAELTCKTYERDGAPASTSCVARASLH